MEGGHQWTRPGQAVGAGLPTDLIARSPLGLRSPARAQGPGQWRARWVLLGTALGGLWLGACQTATPAPPRETATVAPTIFVSSTARPTASSTPSPTVTPPPTLTARPALSFAPSPTPGPQALGVNNAAQIEPLAVWGKGVIGALAWSPDGHELALASGLGVDLSRVEPLELATFLQTDFAVRQVAYSPDGRYLAVAGTQVQLWDRLTATIVATLPGVIENGIRHLEFSRGGTWLVAVGTTSGGGDPGARLIVWRVDDRQIQRTWETDFCGGGADFALSPDGRRLARLVCGQLWVEQTATGDEVYTPAGEQSLTAIAFSADGSAVVASTYADPEGLRIFSLDPQSPDRQLKLQASMALAVSADGAALLLDGIWDAGQRAWLTQIVDAQDGAVRVSLTDVRLAVLSPDGQSLAVVAHSDGAVRLLDVFAPEPRSSLAWPPVVTHLAFGRSADGAIVLASGDQQGRVVLRDPESGREIFATQAFSDSLSAVALDASGRYLAAAHVEDDRGGLVIFEVSSGVEVQRFGFEGSWGYELPVDALAFNLEGTAIAARTGTFGAVRAWQIATGTELEHPEQELWVQAKDLGGDAQGHLWSLDLDADQASARLTLRDRYRQSPAFVQQLLPVSRYCQELQRIAVSAEGRYVALGCDMPEIAIWDLARAAQVVTAPAHIGVGGDGFYGNVLDLDFAPYDALLATSGYDDTIRLWNAATAAPLFVLNGHRGSVTQITWSPDGRWLASVSTDGTIRLWGKVP